MFPFTKPHCLIQNIDLGTLVNIVHPHIKVKLFSVAMVTVVEDNYQTVSRTLTVSLIFAGTSVSFGGRGQVAWHLVDDLAQQERLGPKTSLISSYQRFVALVDDFSFNNHKNPRQM